MKSRSLHPNTPVPIERSDSIDACLAHSSRARLKRIHPANSGDRIATFAPRASSAVNRVVNGQQSRNEANPSAPVSQQGRVVYRAEKFALEKTK